GLEVAVRVADLGRQRLGRARGDARRIAGEGEVIGGADGDREGRAVARQPRLRGGERERADRLAGDGQRGDAAGGGDGAEPCDGAGAGGLGEPAHGRVVVGLEVAGRVTQLGGQRLRRAGGDAGGVAGEGEMVGRADGDREGGRVAGQASLRS